MTLVCDGDDTSEVLRELTTGLIGAIGRFLQVYPQSFMTPMLRHWRSQRLISKLDYIGFLVATRSTQPRVILRFGDAGYD